MAYTEQQMADMRRYVAIWKETGPLLEQIKAEELQAMTDEEARNTVNEVLLMGDFWMQQNPDYVRNGSGLVEQQEIFRLWKKPST